MQISSRAMFIEMWSCVYWN